MYVGMYSMYVRIGCRYAFDVGMYIVCSGCRYIFDLGMCWM